MEDDHFPSVTTQRLGGFDPGNRLALFIRTGVAVGAHDHTAGGARIEVDHRVVERSGAGGPKDLKEIAFEPDQQHLTFGIAEAAVELQHLRPGRGED